MKDNKTNINRTENKLVENRPQPLLYGVTGLSVVDTFSTVRKILVRLTREPAVAY
jgi:hypothetical protein